MYTSKTARPDNNESVHIAHTAKILIYGTVLNKKYLKWINIQIADRNGCIHTEDDQHYILGPVK